MNKSFDVFLSHNSKDKPAVRELAEALLARGLKVWLDEWELVPGRPWQETLEGVIETTGSAAVLVGKDGLGPWQDREMRGCLSEFVDRNLPVIPVLLPDAPEKPTLPIFLKGFTWVDLRGGLTKEGIDRLQWGITGRRLDRSKSPSTPTAAPKTAAVTKTELTEGQPIFAEVRTLEAEVPKAVAQDPVRTARTGRWKEAGWGVGVVAVSFLVGYSITPLLRDWMHSSSPQSSNQVPPPSVVSAPSTPGGTPCVPGELRTENGIDFVRICPGTFTMGSADNDPQAKSDEKPAHEVKLSEFWVGKTEMTNKQYRRFRQDHPGEAELPATNVSWADAKAACEHFGGRLPTEAEWEYAASAGSRTAWSFGDDEKLLGNYAWYENNAGRTPHTAGMKEPNDWGLHDMHGNVWEWVADWYGAYLAAEQPDPMGRPAGESRVWRGGSVVNPARELRSARRFMGHPESQNMFVGFRCVRGPRRQP